METLFFNDFIDLPINIYNNKVDTVTHLPKEFHNITAKDWWRMKIDDSSIIIYRLNN